MDPPKGVSFTLPVLATFALVSLLTIAIGANQPHGEALRWMRGLPRASLAQPREGPAVYSGVLRGPEGRVTPRGQRSAVGFWWVLASSKGSARTLCSGAERGELTLTDGAASARIAFADVRGDVAIIAPDRYEGWRQRVLFDLGEQTARLSENLPSVGSRDCGDGSQRRYRERSIPQGAQVEVVACYRDGVLGACRDAPYDGIVAAGSLRLHRAHRVNDAQGDYAIAAGVLLVLYLIFGIGLVTLRALTFQGLRPSAGKP